MNVIGQQLISMFGNYETALAMLAMAFALILWASGMTFLIRETKSDVIRDRSKTKMSKQIKEQLSKMLYDINTDLKSKKRFYDNMGKQEPLSYRLKKIVLSPISNVKSLISFVIMAAGFGTAGVLFVLTSLTVNPVVGGLIMLCLVAGTLAILNVVLIQSSTKTYLKSVDVLTAIHSQYINASSFTLAMSRVLQITNETDEFYIPIKKFVDGIEFLNIGLSQSLQTLQKDLGDIPQINQYFSIVQKAEEEDSSVKNSLLGIPDNLARVAQQKKYFAKEMFLAGIIESWVVGGIILASLFKLTNTEYLRELTMNNGIGIIQASLILESVALLGSVYITRLPELKKWGMK